MMKEMQAEPAAVTVDRDAGARNARSEYRTGRVAAQTAAASNSPDALLHIDTVSAMVGLSRTSIYDRIRAGLFPPPVRLSARCSRWIALSISDFLKAQQVGVGK